jgi:hypothetical protein
VADVPLNIILKINIVEARGSRREFETNKPINCTLTTKITIMNTSDPTSSDSSPSNGTNIAQNSENSVIGHSIDSFNHLDSNVSQFMWSDNDPEVRDTGSSCKGSSSLPIAAIAPPLETVNNKQNASINGKGNEKECKTVVTIHGIPLNRPKEEMEQEIMISIVNKLNSKSKASQIKSNAKQIDSISSWRDSEFSVKATVTFKNEEDAIALLKDNFLVIGVHGCLLTSNNARFCFKSNNAKTAVLAGISPLTNSKEIIEKLKGVEGVVSVIVATSKSHSGNRGFAFVRFDSIEKMRAAITAKPEVRIQFQKHVDTAVLVNLDEKLCSTCHLPFHEFCPVSSKIFSNRQPALNLQNLVQKGKSFASMVNGSTMKATFAPLIQSQKSASELDLVLENEILKGRIEKVEKKYAMLEQVMMQNFEIIELLKGIVQKQEDMIKHQKEERAPNPAPSVPNVARPSPSISKKSPVVLEILKRTTKKVVEKRTATAFVSPPSSEQNFVTAILSPARKESIHAEQSEKVVADRVNASPSTEQRVITAILSPTRKNPIHAETTPTGKVVKEKMLKKCNSPLKNEIKSPRNPRVSQIKATETSISKKLKEFVSPLKQSPPLPAFNTRVSDRLASKKTQSTSILKF